MRHPGIKSDIKHFAMPLWNMMFGQQAALHASLEPLIQTQVLTHSMQVLIIFFNNI
jgi:hypothetical protein